jgi:hypothetical protein
MSGNSATAAWMLAVFLAAAGWAEAAAQGPSPPDPSSAAARGEIARAQRELTAAETVLRDARDARVKIEAAANDRLARIDERRRSASALADETQRRNALRTLDAETKDARDEIAKARAAETIAEQNAEIAALALARVRSGNRTPGQGDPAADRGAARDAARRARAGARGVPAAGAPTGAGTGIGETRSTARPDRGSGAGPSARRAIRRVRCLGPRAHGRGSGRGCARAR